MIGFPSESPARNALSTAIALLFLIAGAPVAFANDSVAEMAAGGLVLRHSADIDMRSEDLFVSAEHVRVAYVFRNRSARPVTSVVAFPMPDEDLSLNREMDTSYPQDFRTSVDGRPIQMQVDRRAVFRGVDRTALLSGLHVPLAEDEAESQRRAIAALPSTDRRRLIAVGLISTDGRSGVDAMWTVRETWYWTQTFPPGRPVRIEHSYRPGVGGTAGVPLSSPDFRNSDAGRRERAEFCVDDAFMAALQRMSSRADGRYPIQEQRIRYILTTGGNWRAPIGDFRLVVDKGSPEAIVSFCGIGIRRISPTRFEMRRTDWRPDRDLAVLIVGRPAEE